MVAFPALLTRPACRSCASSRATRWRCRARASPRSFSGLPGRRPQRVGRVPGRVRPHPPPDVGRSSTTGWSSRARRRCPTWSSSTRATSTCTSIPEIADYTDARPLGPTPGTGWTPRCARPTTASSCPRRSPAAAGAGLLQPRLARLGRRRPDAAGHRRRWPPPRTATSSPRARCTPRLELADNMWGAEFVPADQDHSAGRPGDHARRQQHHHRGAALRQADDRAAARSGTSTTTPSGSTSSATACASTPTASPTTELTGAIERLLGDTELRERLRPRARRSAAGRPAGGGRRDRAGRRLTAPRITDDEGEVSMGKLINPATGDVSAGRGRHRSGWPPRCGGSVAAAFEQWREATPAERSRVLLRVADLVEAGRRGADPAARSSETGKPRR